MTDHSGPRPEDIPGIEDAHASGGVRRRPVTIVRGAAARLWDDTGKEYIDCASAHGWANVGHCHPDVVSAIERQARCLMALNESAYNDQRAQWYSTLAGILGDQFGTTDRGALSRIHACNSGAEAVEAALKFARFYTGRTQFVAFGGGFHGRTFGALSVTSTRRYREPFDPLVPGVTHVPFNDSNAVDDEVTDDTAGVIVEIIQGEGGVREAKAEFIGQVQRICRERGALFIVDEIQTGFGRTGRWFACQHVGAEPDMVVLAKALGGGLPMGAAVWRSGLGQFETGLHGSTFGAAPLACAASIASMRVLERDALPERADALGRRAHEELRSCVSTPDQPTIVREVRGRGLMIGIELRRSVTPVLRALVDAGVWALPAGKNVLRLMPPLVITEEELSRAVGLVIAALRGA